MKKALAALFLTVALGMAHGQYIPIGSPGFTVVSTAPSGSCNPQVGQFVWLTGDSWSCVSGTWTKGNGSGGGSGTVTNVTGTANQIDVATGTTTPVLSIDPVLIIPGTSTISGNGAASVAPLLMNGTVFTGGSATTTFPYFTMSPTGSTAVTAWQTGGTMFGINCPTGVSGALDVHINGGATNNFFLNCNGNILDTNGSAGFAAVTSTSSFWGFSAAAATAARLSNTSILSWSSTGAFTGTTDVGFDRSAAGVVEVNLGTAQGSGGSLKLQKILTSANCANGASPAVCAAAAAGSVAIPTGVNPTLVVNTTAVTAASEILLTVDDSVTIGATTCNSTLATLVGGTAVTARTAGTSFTISFNGTITTNPVCLSFSIVN